MSAPEQRPTMDTLPCPHCNVVGHWPVYEREELAAGRCPMSGLFLVRTEVAVGRHLFMCGVCDCFGYLPEEVDGVAD